MGNPPTTQLALLLGGRSLGRVQRLLSWLLSREDKDLGVVSHAPPGVREAVGLWPLPSALSPASTVPASQVACVRLWQFAHPRALSLLQRGLAPRFKGKARAELWPARRPITTQLHRCLPSVYCVHEAPF